MSIATFRSKILLFGLACLLGTASQTNAFAKSHHHIEDDTYSSNSFWSGGSISAQCRAQGGDYLTGTIVSGPFFVSARKSQRGVALSHTQIILRAPSGRTYDIRADNVFANGYDQAGPDQVPAPLSTLSPGDQLSLCGHAYKTRTGGMGMDWVHTNCGKPPGRHTPNGWLRQLSPAMTNSPNLEGSEEYCHLW